MGKYKTALSLCDVGSAAFGPQIACSHGGVANAFPFRTAVIVVFLFIASCLSAGVRAQERHEPFSDCFDLVFESVTPACTVEERRKLRADFGLPPIEASALAGRKEIVGYSSYKLGGGAALIARNDRNGPWIEVRLKPADSARSKPVRYRTKLSQSDWRKLLAKADALGPPPNPDDICTAGATFMIEITEGADEVRGRRGHSCGQDPAIDLFFELAKAALVAMPRCAIPKSKVLDRRSDVLSKCLKADRGRRRR